MMRKLKFRAWDGFNGKMYYPDGNGYFFDEFSHDEFVIDGNGQPIFLSDMSTPDKITLEQYTGLKGKNGTDIYEGDLVTGGEYKYQIYWHPNVSAFVFCIDGIRDSWLFHTQIESEIEVIGNIHEE